MRRLDAIVTMNSFDSPCLQLAAMIHRPVTSNIGPLPWHRYLARGACFITLEPGSLVHLEL